MVAGGAMASKRKTKIHCHWVEGLSATTTMTMTTALWLILAPALSAVRPKNQLLTGLSRILTSQTWFSDLAEPWIWANIKLFFWSKSGPNLQWTRGANASHCCEWECPHWTKQHRSIAWKFACSSPLWIRPQGYDFVMCCLLRNYSTKTKTPADRIRPSKS